MAAPNSIALAPIGVIATLFSSVEELETVDMAVAPGADCLAPLNAATPTDTS